MKLLGFDRVLCLSPHPDDVEYSLGGSILKCEGTRFDVACLSTGSIGDHTSGRHRHEELEAFWDGVDHVDLHFTEASFLLEKSEEEWLNYVHERFFSRHEYDAVFAPSHQDSHYEHRLISQLAHPLVRARPAAVVFYPVPSTLSSWHPNVFVDVADVYEEKLRRLKLFATQDHPYFDTDVIRAFHSHFQAAKRGVAIIERFELEQLFT